jgi:hypothetical protein
MKNVSKKMLAVIALLMLLPATSGEKNIEVGNLSTLDSDEEVEFYLLRGEHYLFVNASQDVDDAFHIWFSFPPDYNYQVPILLEILDDSTANILHYQIEADKNKPNKLVNFTIGPMKKGEGVLIHFTCWVLVENHEFQDLPKYVKLPEEDELPKEVKTWLTSTEVVQVDNFFIKRKARQLRGLNNNLIRYADRVASFIKKHRYWLFVIQLNLGVFFSQDAVTTLFINGENVGRSHLGCALLRTYNTPARVILAHNDQGFWTQMHYMIEYYCPGYGWVLIDSTKGETPYATKRQIINRICYPEDEEDTKTDYIFPLMKGEERWLWIDNENIYPYYVDCRKGSKSQMFTEANVSVDLFIAGFAFNLTQKVFQKYERYLGLDLDWENLVHFKNAVDYQKQAVIELKESKDINDYIYFMTKAYDEYNEIRVKGKNDDVFLPISIYQ